MAESLAMLPWFPGDFMRSTRGWSVTAKGVYRELLDAQWDLGSLPADPDELRALIHATAAEWAIGWPRCESKFVVCTDGQRRNTVLEHHRDRTMKFRASRVAGGKATAAKRWACGSSAIAQLPHSLSGDAVAEQALPSPSPSPSPYPSPNRTFRSSQSSLPQQADSDRRAINGRRKRGAERERETPAAIAERRAAESASVPDAVRAALPDKRVRRP